MNVVPMERALKRRVQPHQILNHTHIDLRGLRSKVTNYSVFTKEHAEQEAN